MPFCETFIPQSPGIPIVGLKQSHEADYVAVSRANHTVEVRTIQTYTSYLI